MWKNIIKKVSLDEWTKHYEESTNETDEQNTSTRRMSTEQYTSREMNKNKEKYTNGTQLVNNLWKASRNVKKQTSTSNEEKQTG